MNVEPLPSKVDEGWAQAAALMTQLKPKVRSIALRRLGDAALADDIFQETTIIVLKQWTAKVSSHPNPEGFVIAVAKNMCARAAEALAKAKEIERKLSSVRPTSATEADICDKVYIEQALTKLSPRQLEAIKLRYFLDYTEAEIADHMGIRVGTVKALLNQAHNKLRNQTTN